MRAAILIKNGNAKESFEIRNTELPHPGPNQVRIKVQGFGLNFADVMARLGLYKAAPPLPSILGYDVVGHIESVGENVINLQVGDRVIALTRFGGYAEYALAENEVAVKISEEIPNGEAVALSTQYCTAYFLAHEMANIQKEDKVLIHAAAGGVGTALTQMAFHAGCEIFGTCGSQEKIEYIRANGVHHPINYRAVAFSTAVKEILGDDDGLDAIFDPVGGKSIKQDFKLLGAGGRVLSFGFSAMNQAASIFGKIRAVAGFGIYHPVQFLSNSKGMIGVNMLEVANKKPHKITRVMRAVTKMYSDKIIKPHVGGEYSVEDIGAAHAFLESRKSMGKIVVNW